MNPHATTRPVPATPRAHRILLVDDDPAVLRSLQRLLRREPYELVAASSGAEALALLDGPPFHVVVTDHRITGTSGVDLLRAVRERSPETIRIILSGYSQVTAILDSVNQGAIYKFLTKPWNDEELKLQLRRALDQFDLEAENRALLAALEHSNAEIRALNDMLARRAADAEHGHACCERIIETIDVGIVVIADGMIVKANPAAVRLMRDSVAGELVGSVAATVLPARVLSALALHDDGDTFVFRLACDSRIYECRGREASGDGDDVAGHVLAIWERYA